MPCSPFTPSKKIEVEPHLQPQRFGFFPQLLYPSPIQSTWGHPNRESSGEAVKSGRGK
ncbi:hypothetical protein SLEP1_g57162 [Rubroshorea leprosula]|uniref:Uncharacterized protein n=1 Tax=Rubroshorea leprosula TaxID=152421 RepID=A0AAV5MKK3_9ROSI|nr:hypothetical protein SLEP1_g57162 [Rubroshorea leprosula]